MLGQREPDIYGAQSLPDIIQSLEQQAQQQACKLEHFQSNLEGELVGRIQQAASDGTRALVINAGAYTHTSIALRDALTAVAIPFVEVHLSNTFAREEYRHNSYLSDISVGVICGFGAQSYDLALQAAIAHINN